MNRVVLLFLDGVGIGPDDPECNPFLCARLPALTGLLGTLPTLSQPVRCTSSARSVPLDATLGVRARDPAEWHGADGSAHRHQCGGALRWSLRALDAGGCQAAPRGA